MYNVATILQARKIMNISRCVVKEFFRHLQHEEVWVHVGIGNCVNKIPMTFDAAVALANISKGKVLLDYNKVYAEVSK